MFGKRRPPDCENCPARKDLEHSLSCAQAAHDASFARRVKQDTDIINGLLREIEALHYLLEQQSKNGDEKGEDGSCYIYDCQNVHV